MAPTLQVVLDCADPAAQAQFWAAALGYVVQPPPPGHESWPDFLRELSLPASWSNSSNGAQSPPCISRMRKSATCGGKARR